MSMTAVRAGQAYIELTTKDSKLQKGLQNATARMKVFAATCQSIGSSMMMVSAAMATPFVLAVRSFKDFDTQMRMVKSVTQATGRDFDMLTEKARKIGRETSFTAQQVAEAMTALGRMGLKPQEIDQAIAPVMDLARATGTDLSQAADIAANSLRIFGLDASNMTSVADILTTTANGSAQTLADLFEALKVAGPQAHVAGESISDIAAALGVMANMGIKGSLAGTSLRKAYSQFANPKIQSFLEEYNVKTVDAQGNLRKMRDIMLDVARAMSTMGSAERLAFAKEVFDIRGMTGGLSLTADMAQLDAFIKKLEECNGAAQKTREEMEAGMGGAWDKFVSALSEVGITVGKILAESLTPLLVSITKSINSFGQWIMANKTLVLSLAKVVAAVFAVGSILVTIGATVKVFAGIITLARVGMLAFGTACKSVLALKAIWTATMVAWSAATAAFTTATAAGASGVAAFGAAITAFMATNPVGWCLALVGAIAGIVIALSQLCSKVQETSTKMKDLTQSNDAARRMDRARAERLQQLAEKQTLTNKEMAEAKKITAELEGRYGDFGIKIDESSKSIRNFANAIAQLNTAMVERAIIDLDKQIAEHQKNIETATGYNEDFWTGWDGWGRKISNLGWDYWTLDGSESTAEKAIKQNNAYIASQKRQIEELEARKKRIRSGDQSAVTGEEDGNDVKTAVENGREDAAIAYRQYLDARDEVAKLEEKFNKKDNSALEQEIAEIDKATGKYKELLQVMIDYQQQKVRNLQQTKDNINPEEFNTKLSGKEEIEYQKKYNDSFSHEESWRDYDVRGLYKAYKESGATDWDKFIEENKKKFVKPGSRFFSEESQYAQGKYAQSYGKLAGKWVGKNDDEIKRLEIELARLKGPGITADAGAIEKLEQKIAELKQTNEEVFVNPIDRATEQISEFQRKLEQADADAESRRDKARQKESKRAIDQLSAEAKKFSEASKRIKEQREENKLQREIDKKVAEDPETAIKMLQRLVVKFEDAAKQAAEEYSRAIEDAKKPDADGVVRYTEDERNRVEIARRNFEQSESKVDNFRNQLLRVQDSLKSENSKTLASFDAQTFVGLFGQKSQKDVIEERIAKSGENSEKYLRDIDNKIDSIFRIS